MGIKLVCKCALIALLATGLAGCFSSQATLISADEADYPFKVITYTPAGEDDEITLKRTGDHYVNPDAPDEVTVLFKALGGNLFGVQLTEIKNQKKQHLYGIIKLAPDKTSFEVIKGEAEDHDLAAARKGEAGLTICRHDDGTVCIASLKALAAYTVKAAPSGNAKRFNILKLE